jgi:hypothetical protein
LFIINYLLSQNFIAAGSKKRICLFTSTQRALFLIKTLAASRRQFTTYTHTVRFLVTSQQFTVLIFALGLLGSGCAKYEAGGSRRRQKVAMFMMGKLITVFHFPHQCVLFFMRREFYSVMLLVNVFVYYACKKVIHGL